MNIDDQRNQICQFDCILLDGLPHTYSFSVERNTIHVLFSDNPLVAILLIRCLAGLERPIAGTICYDGKVYNKLTPQLASRIGIEIVDSSDKTFVNLPLLDNIYCERKHIKKTHRQSRQYVKKRFEELSEELGIHLDLKKPMREFSPAERKLSELLRSIIVSPKVLCIEEGVLRDIEDHTFPGIRDKIRLILLRMVNSGLTLLLASNDINEVSTYANSVSIFKQNGENTSLAVAQVDKYQLMQMAYGFITSRTELAQDNFELYYFKQLYQEIINSLIFPVIATDTSHKIIIYNQEVKKVYFSDHDEIIGKHIQDVLNLPESIISDLEKDLLFMPGSRVFKMPNLFKGASIFVSPITDNMGSYMGMLYVFNRDEDSGTIFNSFLNKPTEIEYEYKISELIHEVKNPLSIMLNYLSLIQRETSLKTIKKETEFIANEVARINRLLEKLNVKHIEEHKSFQKEISINAVVQEIYEFLRPTMENKNVEFQNELSDNLSIGFDDVSLRQILINIILNALEASESNGLIKIFAAPVQIESVQYLEIKISDNAGGISPDHLPYIFNPFFTTKNESNSHGIGLSITREIVEQSGGIIKVDSDWGVGTTFTIYLKR